MNSNSFLFRKEWRDATFWLSDSMRLQFYDAVIAYGISRKTPELSPLLIRIFNVVKEEIDKEQEKGEDDEKNQDSTNDEDVADAGNEKEHPKQNVVVTTASIRDHKEAIKDREQKFYEKLVPFFEKYGRALVESFFRYWTEPNKSGTRMRFEMEKTWDVERRLRTWNDNQNKYRNGKTQYNSSSEQRTANTANLISNFLLDESD